MRDLSVLTKVYVVSTMVAGILLVAWNIQYLLASHTSWIMLVVLCLVGGIAQVVKVEGSTNRSHYAISFVIYGFSILQLGLPGTLIVIFVTNLAEYIFKRQMWFIAGFNCASYMVVMAVSQWVYLLINPAGGLQIWQSVLAIVGSMLTFTLLNHLMVGIIIWMARGEDFQKSGIFDFMPLTIDLTMLVMGASLNLMWNYNPFSILLFIIPLYLIYATLRVPALERQVVLDPKTGLYNLNYFMGQLDSELAHAERFDRPLSIIMGDLDLLRLVNNNYGHLAGDEVLRTVAKVFQQQARPVDIVSRFGGEEFVILMPETTQDVAFQVAEEIRLKIASTPMVISTSVTPIQVTISMGIAWRDLPGLSKEEILHNADTALYHAKLKGRNCSYMYDRGAYQGLITRAEEAEANRQAGDGEAPPAHPMGEHSGPDQAAETRGEAHEPGAPEKYDAANAVYRVGKENGTAGATKPAGAKPEPGNGRVTATSSSANQTNIRWYIGFTLVLAFMLLAIFFNTGWPYPDWIGLFLFLLTVGLTEGLSVDIYARDTSVSTSAAPILAGVLLFGPAGAVILSATFSLTAYFKARGPANRILFNFANQMIPAMCILAAIRGFGPYELFPQWAQIAVCLAAMLLIYIFTTLFIAGGMSISGAGGFRRVWIDYFSWLFPYYLVMGLISYSLIFGYLRAGGFGLVVVLAPLLMLRISQVQFINRTRAIVLELREKNSSLEAKSSEIHRLNEGLMDTLAAVIELRDSFVLGHARQVRYYAVLLARSLRLQEEQIELIRKASLLHDLGKLGIPDRILAKPSSLTAEEYKVMKQHSVLGAQLVDKYLSLKALVPIILHHHEHYDGSGYPQGLSGKEIPIEARVIAVADAIEAMASNRAYRPAMKQAEIVAELSRNSGTQFDPEITRLASYLLDTGEITLTPVDIEERFYINNKL